jgi:hypothetical protein
VDEARAPMSVGVARRLGVFWRSFGGIVGHVVL